MMSKSPLKVFLVVFLVVLLLLPLHWIPALTVGNYEVKRISIVSDVVSKTGLAVPDTSTFPVIPLPEAMRPHPDSPEAQPIPKGLVPILDYDRGEGHGMSAFYAALQRRNDMDRPVRIAYLGDSFIEADLMTESLREKLQQKFGGSGVGFVDMAPPYAAMRATLRQQYAGWRESCVLHKGSYVRRFLNLSQRYYEPDSIAWTEVSGVRLPGLDSTDVHTLYLCTAHPHQVTLRLDGRQVQALSAQGGGTVEALRYKSRAHRVRWVVPGGEHVRCYGVAEEGRKGIVLDNLSLRGSSGMQLNHLTVQSMQQWNAVRPYDLIVLQYGLNVANKKQTDYTAYVEQMRKVVDRMKEAFPHTSILIVGVGDRGARNAGGEISTMPGIVELSHYQQKMAADAQVAFWNLYEAMGGQGAMKRMAEAHPAEAAKDYTHITKKGGRRVSAYLFNSMVYGYEQYQR